MTAFLRKLRQDHRHINRLIGHMERQVEQCRQGQDVDMGLLREIVDFATEYSGRMHHPLEARLFGLLRGRDESLDATIDVLEEEHRHLDLATRRLDEMLEGVLCDDVVRRDRFVAACADYVDLFGRHIELEEKGLFPHAEEFLQEADWASLEAEADRRRSPRAKGDTGRRYQRLTRILGSPEPVHG